MKSNIPEISIELQIKHFQEEIASMEMLLKEIGRASCRERV